MTDRPRVDDWIKFDCGDRVHRADDPRHVGRVQAILHGYYARVKWDDLGWLEDVLLDELVMDPEHAAAKKRRRFELWRDRHNEDHD